MGAIHRRGAVVSRGDRKDGTALGKENSLVRVEDMDSFEESWGGRSENIL